MRLEYAQVPSEDADDIIPEYDIHGECDRGIRSIERHCVHSCAGIPLCGCGYEELAYRYWMFRGLQSLFKDDLIAHAANCILTLVSDSAEAKHGADDIYTVLFLPWAAVGGEMMRGPNDSRTISHDLLEALCVFRGWNITTRYRGHDGRFPFGLRSATFGTAGRRHGMLTILDQPKLGENLLQDRFKGVTCWATGIVTLLCARCLHTNVCREIGT